MYAQIGLSNDVTSTSDYTGFYTQNYASFQLTSLHHVALCSLDTGSVVKQSTKEKYTRTSAWEWPHLMWLYRETKSNLSV
jgi:hypothetical protein